MSHETQGHDPTENSRPNATPYRPDHPGVGTGPRIRPGSPSEPTAPCQQPRRTRYATVRYLLLDEMAFARSRPDELPDKSKFFDRQDRNLFRARESRAHRPRSLAKMHPPISGSQRARIALSAHRSKGDTPSL